MEKASKVLSETMGHTLMLTLARQRRKRVSGKRRHQQFEITESNFLKRAEAYSNWIEERVANEKQLRVAQFRDVWSGLPLLARPHLTKIFEVNGLPSVELPYRFKHIGKDTLKKLENLELECLKGSNYIVCPSEVIKTHLINRKIEAEKIHVIPNGAEIPKRTTMPRRIPEKYVVYFGALQSWQGVEVAIKAMQYLADKPELKLVICSSHKEKLARPYYRLIRRLGLEDQIVWKYQLTKKQLFGVLGKAQASLVPLTECSRNLEQGCSPLKVFESMASGAPIIASRLPVIEEIVVDTKEAKLVRADRPADLARAIRFQVDYPERGHALATQATKKFKEYYTWEKVDAQLSKFYDKLLMTDTL